MLHKMIMIQIQIPYHRMPMFRFSIDWNLLFNWCEQQVFYEMARYVHRVDTWTWMKLFNLVNETGNRESLTIIWRKTQYAWTWFTAFLWNDAIVECGLPEQCGMAHSYIGLQWILYESSVIMRWVSLCIFVSCTLHYTAVPMNYRIK